MNKELLQQALCALGVATTPMAEDRQTVLAAISALREAIAQPVDKAIAQPAEPTLNDLDYESFLAQLTDPDDRIFEQIDLWTRQSYARHKASVRGQMITAGDNVDSHRVWAALRWAKEFAQPVESEVPSESQVDEGVMALLQCSESDLESYSPKMCERYAADVTRVYTAMQAQS